jgi:hypothetical protein
MRFFSRLLLSILIVTVTALTGCRGRTEDAAFDGTLGDAMAEFIAAIEGLADDLSTIGDVNDCRAAKGSIEEHVRLLRRLSPIVAVLDAETWKGMPRTVIERRDYAVRSFNREAVRVLVDRDRAQVLRVVVGEVPSLIYLDFQQGS